MSLFWGQSKTEGFFLSISDHAYFRAIPAARVAKCFTMVSFFERGPFFGLLPLCREPRCSCYPEKSFRASLRVVPEPVRADAPIRRVSPGG